MAFYYVVLLLWKEYTDIGLPTWSVDITLYVRADWVNLHSTCSKLETVFVLKHVVPSSTLQRRLVAKIIRHITKFYHKNLLKLLSGTKIFNHL